ncbi:MAG TPA: PilN domain-containing protein [Solirubrobacterales bacterium]|nr:PilN domain-containing protein [Solirubrobacterales bacterium]
MRPVNLIPEGEQHGARKQLRSGPLAYLVVAALVAALAGVAALVLTGNQISESETEIAHLQQEEAAAKAKVAELAGYTQFHSASEQRVATVTSLATSRFDWERVMRELARVLPEDVWLTNMSGSATANAGVEGSGSSGLRGSIAGPALQLSGCATGQESVAGFVQALEEIEGVTRVGVESSMLGNATAGATASATSDSASTGSSCQTRSFIAQFQIVVAFDAAPVPVTAESEAEG